MEILLVEDNWETLQALQDIILSYGHQVTGFDNAEDALEEYKRKFYPIIITDIQLPGMYGLEFCKQIRDLPEGKYSFIIVETGFAEPHELNPLLEFGADDYIQKPIDMELFLVRLQIAEELVKERLEHKKLEEENKKLKLEIEKIKNEGAK
jgi:CheY-like chemotaxis protein